MGFSGCPFRTSFRISSSFSCAKFSTESIQKYPTGLNGAEPKRQLAAALTTTPWETTLSWKWQWQAEVKLKFSAFY